MSDKSCSVAGAVAIPQAFVTEQARSVRAGIALYLALAFAFTCVLLVGAIKLKLGEPYLNVGIAGPAVAAFFCSRSRSQQRNHSLLFRLLWFAPVLILCWAVLLLRYFPPGGAGTPLRLHPFLLIPAIFPAWILSGVFSPNDGVRQLAGRLVHAPRRWSLYALLFFPVLVGIPTIIASSLHMPVLRPPAAIAGALLFFLYNLLFVGTLEEPGWRGFLLDRLQQKLSPLAASLLVWLPWAAWHAPLDYYRPVRFTLINYLLIRVIFLIPITIILTWFYNRSRRSVQSTALFHVCMNTYPFVIPYYQPAFAILFPFAIFAIVSGRMWARSSLTARAASA